MKTDHASIELKYEFRCPVEKLFSAFTNEKTKRLWFADENKAHDLIEFSSNMEVGGKEFCAIVLNEKTPVPGLKIQMSAECMAREDDKALVLSSQMRSEGKLLSLSIETFQFFATSTGSRLEFLCQGTFFEGSDGAILRRAGWESTFNFYQEILS